MADEQLKQFGTEPESAERLAAQAAAALAVLGVHGVSVTTRGDVERVFPVKETPTRRDPLHRTVELPQLETREVAEQFNRLFGRG